MFLRPHEEKLCFSSVFEVNNHAEIINQWFGKTVILSDHRFTYEDAQEIIDKGKGKPKELLKLNALAKLFKKKRMESGAISFEKIKTKFKIDDEGNLFQFILKKVKMLIN